MSLAPVCFICSEPVQTPTCTDQCAAACRESHPSCYSCLMWWYSTQMQQPREDSTAPLFKCPCCRVAASTVTVLGLDIQKEVSLQYAHLQRGSGSAASRPSASSDAAMSDSDAVEPTDVEVGDYAVYYVAGVHKVDNQGDMRYKVVWLPKDVEDGESKFEWVKLDDIGLGAQQKVHEFHQRWHITEADRLRVGFKWEHELPVRSRNKWRCPVGDCVYKTKEWPNCRKHIGSVHKSQSHIVCNGCPGKKFSTKSNLRKHVRTFHSSATPMEL